MEQIYHIKYLHNQKGKSLRKITRETGHDFETVKKYVEKDNFNLELCVKRRKGKLEPYKALIDSWLFDDLNSKSIVGKSIIKQILNTWNFYYIFGEFTFAINISIPSEKSRCYENKLQKNIYQKMGTNYPLFQSNKY
jgi:hypothetical protein